MVFQFFYNIPSTMPHDRWVLLTHTLNNDKSAAGRAVLQHYRGSIQPEEVEIHIAKGKKKIRKFKVRDLGEGKVEVTRLDTPPPLPKKLALVGES
jgi:hypothetical protein